jgi:hypothetical protein
MAVFWVAAPCSLVEVSGRCKGAYCLHHKGSELLMKAGSAYETSVNFYQNTRRQNPKDNHLIEIHSLSRKT